MIQSCHLDTGTQTTIVIHTYPYLLLFYSQMLVNRSSEGAHQQVNDNEKVEHICNAILLSCIGK